MEHCLPCSVNLTVVCILAILASLVDINQALFPTVCVQNATRSGVCCPVPEGLTEPCGWPTRGQCVKFPDSTNGNSRLLLPELESDDRLHWPTHFFQHGCRCLGNYYGYKCSECKYGYTGAQCQQKINVVRKNALHYTAEEKKQFVQAVNMSKYALSEYSSLKVTNRYDAFPAGELLFHQVTIYDLFVYRHYYASRATKSTQTGCEFIINGVLADFAHGGPSILPWHRLMLLTLERELQRLSGDPEFTIPYWDWTDIKGSNCPVCTSDFLGETDYSDPDRHLKAGQPFSEWSSLCDPIKYNGCDACDPTKPMSRISRNPGGNPLIPDMAGSDQLRYAMSLPVFDIYPYNPFFAPNNRSFTDVVSGQLPWKQSPIMLHAQGHAWLNGTMSASVSTSPNDPIFLLHHGFVDKIYEGWLRKYKPDKSQFPGDEAAVGHAADDPIVPFYPPERNIDYFKDSREFGYDYDELETLMMSKEPVLSAFSPQSTGTEKEKHYHYILVAVAGVVAGCVLVTLFVIWKRRSRARDKHSENEPLLTKADTKPYQSLPTNNYYA